MTHDKDTDKQIELLMRENAQLSGLALATGVLLTQLLQSILKTQLNPQAAATQIMSNAREAIDAFTPDTSGERDPIMKSRALDALKQYEAQIRSVLRD